MNRCIVFALVAGAASSVALAQQEVQGVRKLAQPIRLNMDGTPAAPRYQSRSIQNVYDTASTTGFDYAFLGAGNGNKQVIEDINFAPGPWATAPGGGRMISEFQIALGNILATDATFDVIVNLYSTADFDYAGFGAAGAPMLNPTATPFASFRINPGTVPGNQGADYIFDLSTAPVAVPSGACIMQCIITSVGGTTQAASGDPGCFIFETNTRLDNAAVPGFTAIDFGRDNPGNTGDVGTIIGAPAAAGGLSERRLINLPPVLGLGLRIAGEAVVVDPTAENINGASCNIGDGLTTKTGTLGLGAVKWYKVCLTSAATDDAAGGARYIDFDTEGSTDDVSMALYSGGGLIAGDDDSGSNTNAQLSFGIGRRQRADATGVQYDGRGFTGTSKGIPAGTYYLAIAPAASAFGGGYTIATDPSIGGSYTLNIRTNIIGGALADSVSPASDFDVGVFPTASPIIAPGAQAPAQDLGPSQVRWVKFDLCHSTSPTNPVEINANGSPINTGNGMILFDGSGTEVGRSVDPVGLPLPMTFNTAGALTPGTYYLAQFYYTGAATVDTVASGRWHVRSRVNNAGFTFASEINVGWPTCCHGSCVADFDDGSSTGVPDGGVGIEDLLWYLGIYDLGLVCADVDDGNGGGVEDGGVGIEDLLYYLFRYDAGC